MSNKANTFNMANHQKTQAIESFVKYCDVQLGSSPMPRNIEAEIQVLGSIMMSPSIIYKVKKIIQPNDFYEEKHKIIYEVINLLIDRIGTADLLLIKEELKKIDKHKFIGGDLYLLEINRKTPSSANVEHQALMVLDKSCERQAILASAEAFESIKKHENIVDVVYETIHKFENILGDKHTSTLTPEELASDVNAEISKRMNKDYLADSLFTNWFNVDKFIGGFEPGDIVIVAGRTSMGKSHFMKQLTYFWSIENNKSGAYFSLEMKPTQLAYRHIQIESGITPTQIRTGNLTQSEYNKTLEYNSKLEKSKYYLEMHPGMTISEFRARAKELKKRFDIKYIVIDHVGLMNTDTPYSSKEQEQRKISNEVKRTALELNLIIFELVQLNREVMSNKDNRPNLSNLRLSGAYEEDADTVILLHRPEYYGDKTTKINDIDYPSNGISETIIAKNRNGDGTGTAFMFSRDTRNRLVPIDPYLNDLMIAAQSNARDDLNRVQENYNNEEDDDHPF